MSEYIFKKERKELENVIERLTELLIESKIKTRGNTKGVSIKAYVSPVSFTIVIESESNDENS